MTHQHLKPAEGAADLLAAVAAIGRAMQGDFDPQRFLAEFSTCVRAQLPHDRLVIVYREEGGLLSVFAEHSAQATPLHGGRYTIAFDPGGRYTPADLHLAPVLAGEARWVQDVREDAGPPAPAAEACRALLHGLRSQIAVPLRSGDRIIGVLLAGSEAAGGQAAAHVGVAAQVADLIGPFIENVVLLHREQRRRSRLAGLAGLACVFGTSLDFQESFQAVAAAVHPILDFDGMGVGQLGPSGRDLELVGRVDHRPDASVPARIPVEELSFGEKVLAGEPALIRDSRAELDLARPGDRRIVENGYRSCLVVPLWFCQRVGGVLFFGKCRPAWYESADAEIAAAVAAQVVVAMQHQRLAGEQAQRAEAEGRASRLEQRLSRLRQELGDRYGFDRILGRAPSLREALSRAAKVAPTETTVLLTGESGTGKELVARAIHHASPRAEGPYVAVNCAALPETLVESELFGHERGAFTGADRQRPGRFELAAGGTLFLDEVAELPPSAQAKLLRVLQEHEFQRVGGTATLRADVRLIAATNRDLAQAVEDGRFRQDLYYRLNVFRVHLPPLRERGDDVLLLTHHLVRERGARLGKGEPGLSRDAEAALRRHPWRGNIRELTNAVERALILAENGLLTAAHFGLDAAAAPRRADAEGAAEPRVPEALADLERRAILGALRYARGNKTQAAAALGITRTQLHTRLKRFGLSA